jgi:5-formyltetrahydrofolate cyclo-ligase
VTAATLEKVALRSALAAARSRLSPEARSAHARSIADRLEGLPAFVSARIVAAYVSMGAEVDPGPAVQAALARGARVVYPRVVPDDRRLVFAEAWPGTLVRGPLGAAEPPPGAPELARDEIDVILVPAVAVSPDGVRLGRGGGYYDATLPALPRAFRIGLAFDLQLLPALPLEPHDARLDAIATEARLVVCARDSR